MRSQTAATRLAAVLAAILIAPLGPSAEIYWTDYDLGYDGGISRADLDTFTVETLIETGLGRPYRIALDPLGKKMYWTNTIDEGIQRANLDGTDIETIYSGGYSSMASITLDPIGRKVYWGQDGSVYRANLDGSGVEFVVHSGTMIQDLSLDLPNGKIYWSNWDGRYRGSLRRANLDGTEMEDLVTDILDGPVGVGVDPAGGKVYWARWGRRNLPGSIQRANLDGSEVEDLVADVHADSLALDLTAGRVYWSHFDIDFADAWISRSDLDGSNFETLPLGDILPGGIAIIPEPGTLALVLACTLVVLRRR